MAGVSFRREQFQSASVAVGDEVSFVLEPDNKFDPNAVKILKGDIHLGYVPREQCVQVKELIDAGSIKSMIVIRAWSKGAVIEVNYEPAKGA